MGDGGPAVSKSVESGVYEIHDSVVVYRYLSPRLTFSERR